MDAAVLQNIATIALPLLLAITLHEAAHGYAASRCGDPTALMMGRVTLNPIKHIDPVGTILLPLLLFPTGILFGWARPVPVNFANLRRPRLDAVIVSMAGPGSNFVQATIWATILVLVRVTHGVPVESELSGESFVGKLLYPLFEMAKAGVVANYWLGAFNLIPIVPLDGGRILNAMLPEEVSLRFMQLERFGIAIVLALFVFWGDELRILLYPVELFFTAVLR